MYFWSLGIVGLNCHFDGRAGIRVGGRLKGASGSSSSTWTYGTFWSNSSEMAGGDCFSLYESGDDEDEGGGFYLRRSLGVEFAFFVFVAVAGFEEGAAFLGEDGLNGAKGLAWEVVCLE